MRSVSSEGDFILRTAQGGEEIRSCQKLRYNVFYRELAARPDAAAEKGIDADRFDDFAIILSLSAAARLILLPSG